MSEEKISLQEPAQGYLLAEYWINAGFPLKAIHIINELENLPETDTDRNNILKALAYLKINRVDDAAEYADRVRENNIYRGVAKSILLFAFLLNGETDRAEKLMASNNLSPEDYLRTAQFLLEECGKTAREGKQKFPGDKLFHDFLESFKVTDHPARSVQFK